MRSHESSVTRQEAGFPGIRALCAGFCLLYSVLSGHWLEATIPLPDSLSGVDQPQCVVFSLMAGTVYAAGRYDDCVIALDACRMTRIAKIKAHGSRVYDIVTNCTGSRLYCADYDSNQVLVVDCATNRMLASVPVGQGPGALGYNSTDDKVYCGSYQPPTVSIIDCRTNQVVNTVSVAQYPDCFCYNWIGNKVYCGCFSGRSIAVIDGATNQLIKTIPVNGTPTQMCFNPRRNKLYAAGYNSDYVIVIDAAADSVIGMVPVGIWPIAVGYNPIDDKVYCGADFRTGYVIDCASDRVVATLEVGQYPRAIRHSLATNRVYFGSEDDDEVTVVGGTTNRITARINVGSGSYGMCGDPAGLRVYAALWETGDVAAIGCCADTVAQVTSVCGFYPGALLYDGLRKAYAVCPRRAAVVVLDVFSNEVMKVVPTGAWGQASVFNPASRRLYCADCYSGLVSVVDGELDTTIAVLAVGGQPIDLCATPENKVFCAGYASHDVTVIDGSSNRILARIPVQSQPYSLTYNRCTRTVYCGSNTDALVTVIDAVGDSIAAVIRAPHVACRLCCNPVTNKVYCLATNGVQPGYVMVIDGATNQVLKTIRVGVQPVTLCCDTVLNKVYCANYWDANLTVIDGASDSAVATVTCGAYPGGLAVDRQASRVYCAASYGDVVTVIDARANRVDTVLAVGEHPWTMAVVPEHDRLYVANGYGASVSVIRTDDYGLSLAGPSSPEASPLNPVPTIVRGVLWLEPGKPGQSTPGQSLVFLLDIAGRKVLDLQPGLNDVSRLAPGVYFVSERSGDGGRREAVKVVVQH